VKTIIKFGLLSVFVLTTTMRSFGQGQAIISGQDTSRRVITSAVPFLTISPDARAGAMGEVGSAVSADANTVHWNGSKLAFIENKYGFALSYTPWLGKIINDMSVSYLSGYYKITREQAVAASLRYFDLGDIFFTDEFGVDNGQFSPREIAIDATYSRLLAENFSLGVAIRYIHSNLTGNFSSSTIEARPGNSVAVDFSGYWEKDVLLSGANSKFALGGSITNIGAKLSYSDEDNKDFIPTNLRLGTAFTTSLDPFNTLTFGLDFNKLMVPTPPVYELDPTTGGLAVDANGDPIVARGKNPDRGLLSGMFGSFTDAPDGFSEELQEFMIGLGLEYWYNDIFAARGGYFHEHQNKGNRKYFTMGVGFRYQVFGIDFAYLVPTEQNHPLAETLRFTLIFDFDDYSVEEESVTD